LRFATFLNLSSSLKIQNILLKQLDMWVACILLNNNKLYLTKYRESLAMNNVIRTAKQIVNAMAFANVGNMWEFEKLLSQTNRRGGGTHNDETRDRDELNLNSARQSWGEIPI
jgi:hypothetical protein